MSMRDVTIREAGVEITLSVPTSSAADSSSAAASPAPAAKRARADATCAVCALAAAKYTCPRCAVRSCSLACVRRHKRDTGCNGQRDKTAFVSIKQMNTNHLVSDLHFLEEVEHNSERARTHLNNVVGNHSHQVQPPASRRKRKKVGGGNDEAPSSTGSAGAGAGAANGTAAASHSNMTTSKDAGIDADEMLHKNESSKTGGGPQLPTALLQKRTRREKLLMDAALSRGTELMLLSSGMQRRKENSSYWNRKEDVLYWRIIWRTGEGGRSTVMDGADDRKTIASLAHEFPGLLCNINSPSCQGDGGGGGNRSSSSSGSTSNTEKQSICRYYLRKARCPANDQRYYDLGDGEIPLKDALKNRTLVEHPVIRVCGEGVDAPLCVVE